MKSEEVNQKLVYVTVTYTNHSNEEIDHMLYLGALLTLTKENGKVQLYISTEQAGDGYDYISWTGVAKTGEWYIIVSLKIMATVETIFPL